jgi:RNA polymerase sigma-70 factor (ECF subfamily)
MGMTGQAVTMPAAIGRPEEDQAARLSFLFDTHNARLFRLARRMSRNPDDAHDVVQETFLRAARQPFSIPLGSSNEEAWLVRVLINICRDRWRSAAVRSRALVERHVTPAESASPETALIARAAVHRALDRLAPRRRAILVLYELEDVPVKGIASLLGVSAVTVRWHLSVGRREMKRILSAGGTDD